MAPVGRPTSGADSRERADTDRRRTIVLTTAVCVAVVGAGALAQHSPLGAAAVLAGVGLLLVGSVVALSRRDATAVLTLLIVLLFLLPEPYVLVGPLRSVGYPALLVGIGALTLWAAGRVLGTVAARPLHPARWTVLAYLAAAVLALGASFMRALSPLEESGANRSLFPVLAAVGIALIAVDGITSRERLDVLLQRLVLVGGAAAFIGMLEFFDHGFSYRTLMRLPGLTTNVDLTDATRSGFTRVDGAAAHPIEYAVAISVLIPLALHYVLHGGSRAVRRRSAVALVLMLGVVPMTVSRSGLLAIAVGVGVYAVAMTGRQRANAAILGILGLAAFRALVPGLLGTLRSLVFIGSQDPSIAHRTDDYAKVPALLEGHLVIGRGLGTFQPLQYFFLDNQYIGSLLEGGLIGLAALIALFVVGMGLARGARKRAHDVPTRSLGQALAASIAALAAASGTFDQMAFRQTGFLVFLLLGCAGALWSMTVSDQSVAGDLAPAPPQKAR